MSAIAAIVAAHEERIRSVLPGAEVHLTGSASVPDLEASDVDLVVLADDVAAAAARLETVYPLLYPEQWRDDWAAFRDPGPPQVDLVVARPGSLGDLHHRRAWKFLAAEPVLLAEYRGLKAAPEDREERKRTFFDRVVALLPEETSP
jgi:GrpB-like predicted nucleotidyltransferase (UPF0157 family)